MYTLLKMNQMHYHKHPNGMADIHILHVLAMHRVGKKKVLFHFTILATQVNQNYYTYREKQ